MSEYYIIIETDVTPGVRGDTATAIITTTPGTTNLSGQPLTDGWLGTTCNIYRMACGAYPTLDAARAAIHDRGYTERADGYEDEVEAWVTPEALMTDMDFREYYGAYTDTAICGELGITAKTTNKRIAEIAWRVEGDAANDTNINPHGIRLYGTEEYLTELRDELRENNE